VAVGGSGDPSMPHRVVLRHVDVDERAMRRAFEAMLAAGLPLDGCVQGVGTVLQLLLLRSTKSSLLLLLLF
jgi:hypothetical protein